MKSKSFSNSCLAGDLRMFKPSQNMSKLKEMIGEMMKKEKKSLLKEFY